MTSPETFVVVNYSAEGESLRTESFTPDSLDPGHFGYFAKKFLHLSGDLELPLEDKLPGGVGFLDYRIGSDRNGAYVLYYFHDEVVFAALLLSGTDDVSETELMQVFKFLLLDTQDEEEPTEEEIEEVLSSDAFDFPAVESRPAVFEVQLSDPDDESIPIGHVVKLNRQLSAAFFAMDRSDF